MHGHVREHPSRPGKPAGPCSHTLPTLWYIGSLRTQRARAIVAVMKVWCEGIGEGIEHEHVHVLEGLAVAGRAR